jgi:hypothetical protein
MATLLRRVDVRDVAYTGVPAGLISIGFEMVATALLTGSATALKPLRFAGVKEKLDEGRTSIQRPTVGINARFAWGSGSAISPALLAALPALPKALKYTLVNRDLLLMDAEADLVVDISPDAIQRH